MQRSFFVALGLIGVAILLWLGFWQLDRLEWKEELLSEIDQRMSEVPVAVPGQPTKDADNFRQVRVDGTLLGPTAHVLTSERNVGPGYKIIASLDAGAQTLLVDLGFVLLESKPEFEAVSGPVEIIGNLYWPNEVDPRFTPDPDMKDNIYFARDLETMSVTLQTEPIMIVATEVSPNLNTLPQRVAHNLPNDHLNYAITWFALSVVWAGMTLYALFVTGGRNEKSEGA